MAEEVEMTPVAAEPPKADPLAKPAAPLASTLKLNPIARKPVPGGATVSALRPGLKLPPKPGATVSALKPGLKLPPKPGVGASALKPGLKLPPHPGATVSALRPGIKLPPKPVIHKPGATIAAAPLPKPVTPVAAPAAVPKPVAAPVAAATPAAEPPKPAAPVAIDAQGVGKLPTVEAKAIARDAVTPPAVELPKPMEQLKTVTQKLKGITQQIPQQAILRKTGIIADAAMSEAQKEAAKHKTARISLSDAMGVAPVKDEHAPMKTIRIKRPIDIPTAATAPKAETAPAAAPESAAPAAAGAEASGAATITQRKTLRIARPGSAVRPAGKFGIKRPGAVSAAAKPAGAPAAPTAEGAPSEPAVADIADIPEMPLAAGVAVILLPLVVAAALNRFARCRFVLTSFVFAFLLALLFGGAALALAPRQLVRYLPVALLLTCPALVLLAASAAFALRFKANAAASAVGLVFLALLPAVGNYYLSDALSKGGAVPWAYVGLAALVALPAVVAFLLLGVMFGAAKT